MTQRASLRIAVAIKIPFLLSKQAHVERDSIRFSGQFLIPISSAESSPFVECVQDESGYDGVYFQSLSDWHDTCLSKGLISVGGRLLSRWHVARTGIGSKRIDEGIIHGLTATDV